MRSQFFVSLCRALYASAAGMLEVFSSLFSGNICYVASQTVNS